MSLILIKKLGNRYLFQSPDTGQMCCRRFLYLSDI